MHTHKWSWWRYHHGPSFICLQEGVLRSQYHRLREVRPNSSPATNATKLTRIMPVSRRPMGRLTWPCLASAEVAGAASATLPVGACSAPCGWSPRDLAGAAGKCSRTSSAQSVVAVQTGSSSRRHFGLGDSPALLCDDPDEDVCWRSSCSAPLAASRDSSRRSFVRIKAATCCSSLMWPSGTLFSASPVTSAWIPMRYHISSLVSQCLAIVKPRRSNKLMNCSPLFFRFGSSAVKAEPDALAICRPMRSWRETGQP
mmetsp:Transcript_58309/g.177740  ORF Transcript_58309/g.177740 Transcript_58309/m.177740 type:complete len:256 (+) Transcript_58309:158-925(+)